MLQTEYMPEAFSLFSLRHLRAQSDDPLGAAALSKTISEANFQNGTGLRVTVGTGRVGLRSK